MTSIFTGLFSESITRVNARADKQLEPKNTADSRPQEFSQLLADLEENKKKPSNNIVLTEATRDSGSKTELVPSALTNLNQSEKTHIRGRLGVEAFRLSQPPQPAVTIPDQLQPSVKTPQSTVKTSAPGPATPPAPILPNIPPSMPVFVSAERISASPASSVPKTQAVLDTAPEELVNIITTAGRYHGVDPALSLAVADAESSFRPNAVSSDGHESKGLFQLLDSTGLDRMAIQEVKGAYDPFDPGLNSLLGVGYLRDLMGMFSSPTKLSRWTETRAAKNSTDLEKLAVAAFNAGQGNVARAQALAEADGKDPGDYSAVAPYLPASTRQYVTRVGERKQQYAHLGSSNELA